MAVVMAALIHSGDIEVNYGARYGCRRSGVVGQYADVGADRPSPELVRPRRCPWAAGRRSAANCWELPPGDIRAETQRAGRSRRCRVRCIPSWACRAPGHASLRDCGCGTRRSLPSSPSSTARMGWSWAVKGPSTPGRAWMCCPTCAPTRLCSPRCSPMTARASCAICASRPRWSRTHGPAAPWRRVWRVCWAFWAHCRSAPPIWHRPKSAPPHG